MNKTEQIRAALELCVDSPSPLIKQALSILDDHVVVPREPTGAMRAAGHTIIETGRLYPDVIYRAMIQAYESGSDE